MSGGNGNDPYDDGVRRPPPPALAAVHPHHFAMHAIETAFSSAAGIRAAAAAAGLHPSHQTIVEQPGTLPHLGGTSGLHSDTSGFLQQNHQLQPNQSFHHQQLHHIQQQQPQLPPDMSTLSPSSTQMPLYVQLTEGHEQVQVDANAIKEHFPATAGGAEEEDDDDDDNDDDDDEREAREEMKLDIKKEEDVASQELEQEDLNVEKLRQVAGEISDASIIWKVVRPRILSQCQIWDLLMDRASFRFYCEVEKPLEDVDATNSRKFKAVVSEMEVLLGEFKCLMDGCLEPFRSEDKAPADSPASFLNGAAKDEGISLSPELARAYDQTVDFRWSIKRPDDINSLYQYFFSSSTSENEKDRKDALLSAELMYNAFTPYGSKYLDEEYDDHDEESEDVKPVVEAGSAGRKRSCYQDPSVYPYECQNCPRRYKSSNNLRKHVAACRGEPLVPNSHWKKTLDGRYYCTYPGCSEPDRDWAALQGVQKHFNLVHTRPGEPSFPCEYCEIKFSSKNLLNHHRKIKHLTRHPCTQCGKEFSSQLVLQRHTQVHLGNPVEEEEEDEEDDPKPFQCNICEYRTGSQNGIAAHKRSAHNVDKNDRPLVPEGCIDRRRAENCFPYHCDRCTRRYKSTKNLLRHQKNCSGVPPPNVKPTWRKDPLDGRYYCTFEGCNTDKNWTCSSGVWKHYNAEHADVADPGYCVYPCDMCDERFPTKTMYNQHRKHKHLALFQYTCTVCGKRLPSTLRLKLHMRLHTGEKPYKCELCDYRSATQSAVNQHKMRMHEEHSHIALQRHVCEICGKSFKVKSNLKEHIRSHSDARTFLCGFCGKALKNRQCLNRHLFTHGVKYTCQNCGKNFANPSSLHVHRRDKHGVIQ